MLAAGIGIRLKHVENRFFIDSGDDGSTSTPSAPASLIATSAALLPRGQAMMKRTWASSGSARTNLSNWSPLTGSIAQSEIRSWYDFSRISSSAAAPFGARSMSVAPSWFSTAVSAAAMELCSPMISVARGAADVMTLIQPRTSRD
jgi:hypothetical protein